MILGKDDVSFLDDAVKEIDLDYNDSSILFKRMPQTKYYELLGAVTRGEDDLDARLIANSVVDEQNNAIFTTDDVMKIEDGGLLISLIHAVRKQYGMVAGDDAKKKQSETTQGSDSQCVSQKAGTGRSKNTTKKSAAKKKTTG